MLKRISTKIISILIIATLILTLVPTNNTVLAATNKKTVRVKQTATVKTSKRIKKIKASKKGIVKVTFQKKAKKFKIKGLKKGKVTLTVSFTNNKKTKYQITVKAKKKVSAVDSKSLKYAKQVVALVNKERTKRGLKKLEMNNSALQLAATKRAKELKKLFSHTRPDGTICYTVLDEYKIHYMAAGENIAMGQSTPEEVMDSWMHSEGHKANILSKAFTKIGVGVYEYNGYLYWVQLFIGE